MDNKSTTEVIFEHLATLGWPDLKKKGKNELTAGQQDPISILKLDKGRYTLNFIYFDTNKAEYKTNPLNIRFDKNIDVSKVVYFSRRGYKLSYGAQIKPIFQLDRNADNADKIETIEISKKYKKLLISPRQKSIKIPWILYEKILKEAEEVQGEAKSYSTSVERYLVNKLTKKYLNKETKSTTTFKKGEFSFLINRFNLRTKKKKTDFLQYLNGPDITSLQQLFFPLVREEVFPPNFLRRLDDYFIREKLKDIIKIGKGILSLKSTDMETVKAKEIMSILGEKDIKQLETLWQKYFEKYLLYLIFSYKEIYPKVDMELDMDKKFSDFIGINHYNGVDAIEIKTHLTAALTWDGSHKNFSFSPELSKAIIQTMNYMDAIKQERFKDDADKTKITNTTHEENLYRPRGIIIISSADKLVKNTGDYDSKKINRDFTKLRNSLHNIEILTFNEIIEIADRYKEHFMKEETDNT
jgi:hypothetical protein